MKELVKQIFCIAKIAGHALKPALLLLIVTGTILESLSAGLVVPVVILLSRGNTIYSQPFFDFFTSVTGVSSYKIFFLYVLAGIILLYFCKTLFMSYINSVQNKFVFKLEVGLSTQLLKHYAERPYVFHLHNNSAQLIKNIYHEVRNICLAVNSFLFLFSEGLILLLLTGILLYFKPLITLIVLALLGTIVFIVKQILKQRLKTWGVDRQKSDADRISLLSNMFASIKDIKLYGRYKEFYNNYEYKTQKSANSLMRYANLQKLPNLWLEFIAVISLVSLIGMLIINGNTLINIIPLLSLYAAAMFRILPSLNRISGAYQTVKLYQPTITATTIEFKLIGHQ